MLKDSFFHFFYRPWSMDQFHCYVVPRGLIVGSFSAILYSTKWSNLACVLLLLHVNIYIILYIIHIRYTNSRDSAKHFVKEEKSTKKRKPHDINDSTGSRVGKYDFNDKKMAIYTLNAPTLNEWIEKRVKQKISEAHRKGDQNENKNTEKYRWENITN